MATFNVEMRQRVSGSFADIIYPKAHWANIDGKPSTFAPTTHEHAITDLDTTGTPSSTTYLRGDGAWATPEGGGSGGVTYTSIKNWTGILAIASSNVDVPISTNFVEGRKYVVQWRHYNASTYPSVFSMFTVSSTSNADAFISASFDSGGIMCTGGFSIGRTTATNKFIARKGFTAETMSYDQIDYQIIQSDNRYIIDIFEVN